MYNVIQSEIDDQLQKLQTLRPLDYNALKDAWRAARKWGDVGEHRSEDSPLLVPYIGSGLNRLAGNGLGSWQELVSEVEETCKGEVEPLGTPHQIRRSGLTMPQQLEIYLGEAALNRSARRKVLNAFKKAFADQAPSEFHRRLTKMFPVLLTTNYNNILAASDPSKKTVDLTIPKCSPDSDWPTIFHLHGRWDSSLKREELGDRIFAGVGLRKKPNGPCLVLTENQYHHLYADADYIGALQEILGPSHVLLFLGASLSNDEAGIHSILTARQLAGGSFAGLYVGLDMEPLKERLLELRGIRCINLPRSFGYSKAATEALFNALFDVMETRFEVPLPHLAATPDDLLTPEILCVGLAAWNRVFSLANEESIGTEISHTLKSEYILEQPGGQHLLPALHLVDRGHRVALATTTGDDALGDQVRNWVIRYVEDATRKGRGDLFRQPWKNDGSTRLTTAITYNGTRVIFDYDGDNGRGHLKASDIDWDLWAGLKALYIGQYYPECNEELLENLPDVEFKFYESGTRGPIEEPDFECAVKMAKRCTHVLSSSAFALRLAATENFRITADTRVCQKELYDDVANNKALVARKAHQQLWPNLEDSGTLVIVMGDFGSLVVNRDGSFVPIPIAKVDKNAGRNWLGCGDLFRAEFIHQILQGADSESAAKAATNLVASRIPRMSPLSA